MGALNDVSKPQVRHYNDIKEQSIQRSYTTNR